MSEHTSIQRKREKATALPSIQNETVKNSLFASQQDVDQVPSIIDEEIPSDGQPLDDETRAFMEPRFGHDFSKVRIHADGKAAATARSVNAVAYTVGQDITFDSGEYAPETNAGRYLLAHELAHVVQQSRGGDQTPPPVPAHPLEQAAQHAASIVASGGTAHVEGASAPGIARQPRSLNQSLNPASMSDADLQQEIALIRQWLDENQASSPDRDQLTSALSAMEAEMMQRSGRTGDSENVPSSNLASKPVSEMTTTEKLIEAYNRADINQAVRDKISKMFSPEALVVAIISFVGVFIASQLTPVGWAADLGLALTAIFVGTALLTAIQHLVNFADARNAVTSEQLDQAGAEFAQAIAEVEIDAIILLVTHGIGGPEGRTPYEGPPATKVVLATTPEGFVVPVAVETVPAQTISAGTAVQAGVKGAGISEVLMSQGSGSGGGKSEEGESTTPEELINSASKREFYDLDDAATSALGEEATITGEYGPIGPVKNAGVRADLKRLGYNPDEFTAVQYQATSNTGKSYIITVFEAEGGVYYGPHLSSANY